TDLLKKENSINENNHNGQIESTPILHQDIPVDSNSHHKGFMDATRSEGNLTGFDLGIDKLYVDYLNNSENIAEKNEKEILDHANFIKSSEQKINNLIEVKTRINDVEIPEEKKLIKSYKSEKEEARITAKIREPRAGLWVDVAFTGLIILLGLAFIWVFYSSVVYNAFFLEINPEVEGSYTLRSIFNPKAFEQAVAMGDFTLILIITAAPMFLLFGLYPHTYSENKRNGKYKKLFYGVALIVDAVLAYEITHKLYEAQRAFSPDKLPPFSVSIALNEPNFWIIILMGFVGYLFWTLMFDN
ncbi:MAG: hypothetical protein IAE91_04700, partial [Ignavibacteriaceae bacterium]|nr:hypothetical protein [Ignavibacteriaceae bacterium]